MKLNLLTMITILSLIQAISSHSAQLSDEEFNSLINFYRAELPQQSTPQKKFEFALEAFPTEFIHKLFIDKQRLENPEADELLMPAHLIFDVREPGYFAAMSTAFTSLGAEIDKKISLEAIVALHDIAVDGVYEGALYERATMMKGIYPGGFGYDINIDTISKEGLQELFDSGILFCLNSFFNTAFGDEDPNRNLVIRKLIAKTHFTTMVEKKFISNERGGRIVGISKSVVYLESRFEPIFQHYYDSVANNPSFRDILLAIAELLRACEVAHFLPDGNTRTYSFLLLNKLLIENGLPPAILDEPAMFRFAYPLESLADNIEIGIRNFLNESPDQQRMKLSVNGRDYSADLVQSSHYQPFSTKKIAHDIVNEVIAELHEIALLELTPENIDQPIMHYAMTPLNLSIVLNATKLQSEVLNLGASLFLRADDSDPIFVALQLKDLGLLERLLQGSSANKLRQAPPFLMPYLKQQAEWIFENKEDPRATREVLDRIIAALDKITA